MTTGEKIRRLRKERGMTQEELGKKIGVQKAAINKYEAGIVINLKREVINKLAKALGVSPVWLMNDEAEWPPMDFNAELKKRIDQLQTIEAQILAAGVDSMPKEKREQALNIMKTIFIDYADFFKKGDKDDDNT
jgi:transcriptional regulator with XRE-family HTH domain